MTQPITIEECRILRDELERQLCELLNAFTKQTGIAITGFEVQFVDATRIGGTSQATIIGKVTISVRL